MLYFFFCSYYFYSQIKIFDVLLRMMFSKETIRRLLLHTIVIMGKESIKLYFLYQLCYYICFFFQIFLFITKFPCDTLVSKKLWCDKCLKWKRSELKVKLLAICSSQGLFTTTFLLILYLVVIKKRQQVDSLIQYFIGPV